MMIENSSSISYKTKYVIIVQANGCILGHLLRRNENFMFTQKPVHECHSPKLETTQVFFSG